MFRALLPLARFLCRRKCLSSFFSFFGVNPAPTLARISAEPAGDSSATRSGAGLNGASRARLAASISRSFERASHDSGASTLTVTTRAQAQAPSENTSAIATGTNPFTHRRNRIHNVDSRFDRGNRQRVMPKASLTEFPPVVLEAQSTSHPDADRPVPALQRCLHAIVHG